MSLRRPSRGGGAGAGRGARRGYSKEGAVWARDLVSAFSRDSFYRSTLVVVADIYLIYEIYIVFCIA